MTDVCNRYICFLELGFPAEEGDGRYPVGTGSTRDEALVAGIKRGLPTLAGDFHAMHNSRFVTVAQPDLSDEDLAEVERVIDTFFAEQAA